MDSSGDIYITGTTRGALFDVTNGEYDLFLVKLSGAKSVVWSVQRGGTGQEEGCAVKVLGAGLGGFKSKVWKSVGP